MEESGLGFRYYSLRVGYLIIVLCDSRRCFWSIVVMCSV